MSLIEQTSSHMLETLASERRRVFGKWRAFIYCSRLSIKENKPIPDESALEKVFRHMIARRQISTITGVSGVFVVTLPFANLLPMSEEVIVQEANPTSVISHRSALVKHQLTTWVPNEIYATQFNPVQQSRIPLGTTPDDWIDRPFPKGTMPKVVNTISVNWTQTAGKWDFGYEIGWADGLPIYQTDRERTLLDVLRSPEKGGGITEVINAWQTAIASTNIERLIRYTDEFQSPVIRQRVGFLIEACGISHPKLDDWRQHLQRGGSLKFLADAPYSAVYSPRWNLSLNLPETLRDRLNAREYPDE